MIFILPISLKYIALDKKHSFKMYNNLSETDKKCEGGGGNPGLD
jgi:hypothetical protein